MRTAKEAQIGETLYAKDHPVEAITPIRKAKPMVSSEPEKGLAWIFRCSADVSDSHFVPRADVTLVAQ